MQIQVRIARPQEGTTMLYRGTCWLINWTKLLYLSTFPLKVAFYGFLVEELISFPRSILYSSIGIILCTHINMHMDMIHQWHFHASTSMPTLKKQELSKRYKAYKCYHNYKLVDLNKKIQMHSVQSNKSPVSTLYVGPSEAQ